MKKTWCILIALLLPPLGLADDAALRGWYLGGGLAVNNVFTNEDNGLYGSSERGDSDTGFIVNGGYRFNRYFAAEFGYLDGGSPRFESISVVPDEPGPVFTDVVQQTEAWQASIVGILPFARIWEIYAKGGVAFWDATAQQVLTPLTGPPSTERQVDRDGTDFLVGIGFGVSIRKHLHLRFEAQAFRTDDDLLVVGLDDREARFDSFTAELHWRFGEHW